MNRTWKDAACEVAYNRGKELYKDLKYEYNLSMHCVVGPISKYDFFDKFSISYIRFTLDFTIFRAAFMKWLDDNEVKK